MGKQFNLYDANENIYLLRNQTFDLENYMKNLREVIDNFLNVEGFSGATEQQVKGFMREVGIGAIESINILSENVASEYAKIQRRFADIDGGTGITINIYEDKLIETKNDNNTFLVSITNETNVTNSILSKTEKWGLTLAKCSLFGSNYKKEEIDKKITDFETAFITVADNFQEAMNIEIFSNSVKQFVNYLGVTSPSTYVSGNLAQQPFYSIYASKALEIMKAKSYDYYAPKSPKDMTDIEKYAIAEKLAEDTRKARNGDIEAKTRLENFFRDVASSVYHKGELPNDGNDYVAKRFAEYAVILDSVSRAKVATIEVALKNLPAEKRSGLYPDDIQEQIDSLKDYNLASSIFSSMASVSESLNSQTEHYTLSPFNLSDGYNFFGTTAWQSENFKDKPFRLNFSKDEYGSTVVDIEVQLKKSELYVSENGQSKGFQITSTTRNTKVVQGNSGIVTHTELGKYFEKTYKEAQENLKSANDALVFSVASELIGKFGDVGTAFGTLNTATGLQGQIQAVYEAQKNLKQVGIDKEKFNKLTAADLLDNECTVTVAPDGSVQIIPTMEMYNIITALNKYNKSNYTFSDLSNVEKLEQAAKEYNKLVEEYKQKGLREAQIEDNIKKYGNPYGNPNAPDENGRKAREYLGGN